MPLAKNFNSNFSNNTKVMIFIYAKLFIKVVRAQTCKVETGNETYDRLRGMKNKEETDHVLNNCCNNLFRLWSSVTFRILQLKLKNTS